MKIHNISKEDKKVVVSLTSEELVAICNLLYSKKEKRELELQLYSQMMMARDICQYGNIDDFCLAKIVKCRGYEIKSNLEKEDDKGFELFEKLEITKTKEGDVITIKGE